MEWAELESFSIRGLRTEYMNSYYIVHVYICIYTGETKYIIMFFKSDITLILNVKFREEGRKERRRGREGGRK